eukprot:296742-Chlamydomonas_euryale.AAC.1
MAAFACACNHTCIHMHPHMQRTPGATWMLQHADTRAAAAVGSNGGPDIRLAVPGAQQCRGVADGQARWVLRMGRHVGC